MIIIINEYIQQCVIITFPYMKYIRILKKKKKKLKNKYKQKLKKKNETIKSYLNIPYKSNQTTSRESQCL